MLAGLGAAIGLRAAAGGADEAASIPAALVFAAALLALVTGGGLRHVITLNRSAALVGIGGGAVLIAVWTLGRGGVPAPVAPDSASLALWSPLVVLVAFAEEAMLRGALFDALSDWRGTWVALLATSLMFGLMHVPLYGWRALPVDIAAGFVFGGLRIASGSVAAPAIAHALADLAGGWLA